VDQTQKEVKPPLVSLASRKRVAGNQNQGREKGEGALLFLTNREDERIQSGKIWKSIGGDRRLTAESGLGVKTGGKRQSKIPFVLRSV